MGIVVLRPQVGWDRQQPVAPAQLDDFRQVILPGDAAGEQVGPQAPDLVAVKVAEGAAELPGRRGRQRAEAVGLQLLENTLVVGESRVHLALILSQRRKAILSVPLESQRLPRTVFLRLCYYAHHAGGSRRSEAGDRRSGSICHLRPSISHLRPLYHSHHIEEHLWLK